MSSPAAAPRAAEKPELRRDATTWGSYMWGCADVQADIYALRSIVIAAM